MVRESIEAWSGLLAVFFGCSVLFSVLFIRIGVSLSRRPSEPSFKRILGTAVACSLMTYGLTVLLTALFPLDGRVSFFIGLALNPFVLRKALRFCGLRLAVLSFLNAAAQVLGLWAGVSLFVGRIVDFFIML